MLTTANKKKHLLLINPAPNSNTGAQLHLENLGLGYIATSVRKNLHDTHDVFLWDCSIVDPMMRYTKSLITTVAPEYIGLSLTSMNAYQGLALTDLIKKTNPQIKIILGGILASTLHTKELSIFHPDAIIRGEGERLINHVLEQFDTTQELGLIDVLQETALDVDHLGWTSRDMLPWQLKQHPQTSISASRGCPYRCSFCSIPQSGKRRSWRPRDIEDVVAEMQYTNKKYKSSHFYFVDDNFIVDSKASYERAAQFAHLVLKKLPPVRFGFMCRSATINKHLFKLLKRAGLSGVFLGIESFSQPVLDRYKKRETVEEHLGAIHILNELGITINPGFIFFDPWTSIPEINDTLNVMEKIDFPALQAINSKLTCYRGTDLEKDIIGDDSSASKIGIKSYRFQLKKTENLFDTCCKIFYQHLSVVGEYRNYQKLQYCLGYLHPYFINTDQEAHFLKNYTQCKSLWESGDFIILQWIRDLANETPGRCTDIDALIETSAKSYWQRGNTLAEKIITFSEEYFLDKISGETTEEARLDSLAFTLPYNKFSIDRLFKYLLEKNSKNYLTLAEMLLFYKGDNSISYCNSILKNANSEIISAVIESALLTRNVSLLKMVDHALPQPGTQTEKELLTAKNLLHLTYPEFILACAQHKNASQIEAMPVP